MGNKIKRGDILLVSLHDAQGMEQKGFRPAICIQNDVGNKHSATTIIAPITSSDKRKKLPVHVSLSYKNKNLGLSKNSVVMLEQIRVIDKSRIVKIIGALPKNQMYKVDKAVQISLGIND